METCCCGNVTRPEVEVVIRLLVCRCAAPGRGKRQGRRKADIERVQEKQWHERKRLGLPVMTDVEKALENETWS
jgi:hypothetical protein